MEVNSDYLLGKSIFDYVQETLFAVQIYTKLKVIQISYKIKKKNSL